MTFQGQVKYEVSQATTALLDLADVAQVSALYVVCPAETELDTAV